jgi:hypothetical protein
MKTSPLGLYEMRSMWRLDAAQHNYTSPTISPCTAEVPSSIRVYAFIDPKNATAKAQRREGRKGNDGL